MKTPLNIQYINDPVNWIDELLDENIKSNYVNGVLPNIYAHYFKLYLPIGLVEESENEPTQLTYKELALRAELDYTSNFSYTNLATKFGGIPSNFEVIKKNDHVFLDNFISIFGRETNTVFESFGDDIFPEEFESVWKIEGKLILLKEIFSQLNRDNYHDFNHFPNYIYSADKSWCTATKIFQSGIILLGCNKDAAEKIYSQNVIDFQEIKYGDQYFEWLRR